MTERWLYFRKVTWRRWRTNGFLSLGWWRTRIPFWLTLDFYWLILTAPLRWFSAAWYERKLKNLLWGLPAILTLVCVSMVFHRINQQSSTVIAEYWIESQQAINAKNYPVAELLLDRIVLDGSAHFNDARFALAVVYQETGRQDQAEFLFNSMAPDDTRGYPEAHRRLAILRSESISLQSTREELARYFWHLEGALDDSSPEMALAWGRYHIAIGNFPKAERYLEVATKEYPEFWVSLAEVRTQMGSTQQAIDSYDRARVYLSEKLAKTPDDEKTRVDYVTVLMRLGQMDSAREILEEAMKQNPDGQWSRLLANFYVNLHDLIAMEGNNSPGDLLIPLSTSLEYDPNCGPALNRLMSYVTADVEGNGALRTILSRTVAEGKEPALAHLALGNLCWIERDNPSALFHFERAIALNKKLAVVMNNLAWLLAHDEDRKDLDRAMALVNAALAEQPANASFLDTRGTVHMKKAEYKEALNDLEIALRGIANAAPLHAKLAEIYTALGQGEMAKQHQLLEEQLRAEAGESTPR